ncbi:MAG: glutamine--fructose-6-phosphate transaminase (isomerizing) [Candidatus Kerfeldbacteria bacterium]|nr:glutamine--fructose-6-phosphate transaminase (isomerizing) [Candidatus Kerfeldbacteria bacterium]
MCGIVGYIGNREASGILLDGLHRLEYRGYDSAGLAVVDGKQIKRVRVQGKVAALASKLKQEPLSGSSGIAHTRWATHGAPSEANAHPHCDDKGRVYVVHNGIVENYAPLKQELQQEGHVFSSETDTEVIAHLISKFLDENTPLELAVKKVLKLIKGTYALLVIAVAEPGKIVAARQSSPLRLGVGQDEFIIASDASAIANYTKQLITLGDGEVAVITRAGYTISELHGEVDLDKDIEEIDWNLDEAGKGDFPHYMLKEIFEQPEAIKNSLRGRLLVEDGQAVLGGLRQVEDRLRKIKRLHLIACGTAYHAALVGEYMLEEYANVPTEVCVASEFRYRKAILDPETEAVLVISQSGETADTLAAVKEAKEKGLLTLGIVNVVGSSIAQATEAGIYNHVGPEIGVASTKAFTSQLTVLALLTLFLGRQRNMSLVIGKRIAEELKALPLKIEKILAGSQLISQLAKKYVRVNNFYYVGRKYNYPIALEGALKLKEISYIHAEGAPAGELKHGPLAMIDSNFPALFIIPQDSVYEKNVSNLEEVRTRGAKLLAIATAGDNRLAGLADEVLYIPKTLEMLTPILSVVPLQLLAYQLAISLDRDVDKPRNLAKSVTVE